MTAVAAFYRNGAAANGYAKVGDTLSANLTGFTGNNAVTVKITGPYTDVELDGTLATGALDTTSTSKVRIPQEGIYTLTATDNQGVSDSDTVEVFRVNP